MGVAVTIFGHNYVVAGDKEKEEIEKVAEYVDNKMHMISKIGGQIGVGTVGTLTALNIADEYFDALNQIEKLKAENDKLEREADHYAKKLDDLKKSYAQSKENMDKLMKNQMQSKSGDADKVAELEQKCNEYESTIFDLHMENIQLKSALEKAGRD